MARFRNLDEAIIAEFTKRFDRQFFGAMEYTKQLVSSRNEEIFRSKERGLAPEVERIIDDVAMLQAETLPDGQRLMRLTEYSHPKRREELWSLIERLHESLGRSMDREAIFGLFAQAVLSGRLLPLARVVEQAFGKGSFRFLAERTSVELSPQI